MNETKETGISCPAFCKKYPHIVISAAVILAFILGLVIGGYIGGRGLNHFPQRGEMMRGGFNDERGYAPTGRMGRQNPQNSQTEQKDIPTNALPSVPYPSGNGATPPTQPIPATGTGA